MKMDSHAARTPVRGLVDEKELSWREEFDKLPFNCGRELLYNHKLLAFALSFELWWFMHAMGMQTRPTHFLRHPPTYLQCPSASEVPFRASRQVKQAAHP